MSPNLLWRSTQSARIGMFKKNSHRVSVVRATHHYFLHIYNLEFAFVKKTSQKRPFWSGLIQLSNLIEHLEAHQFAKNIFMTSNRKNKRSVKNFYFDRIVEKWIKCLFFSYLFGEMVFCYQNCSDLWIFFFQILGLQPRISNFFRSLEQFVQTV